MNYVAISVKYSYTPETKFVGVYRSHPVIGWLVGWLFGRSVSPAVRFNVKRPISLWNINTFLYTHKFYRYFGVAGVSYNTTYMLK
jgi:hypothetical protein